VRGRHEHELRHENDVQERNSAADGRSEEGFCLDREADRAVADLARLRGPTYVDGDGDTVLHAFELAETTGHDVYDCYLTALAKRGEATHLVTTDSGLRRVCETVGIAYENPVPSSVLARFRVRGRRGE